MCALAITGAAHRFRKLQPSRLTRLRYDRITNALFTNYYSWLRKDYEPLDPVADRLVTPATGNNVITATALLLPDGTVMKAGSTGGFSGPRDLRSAKFALIKLGSVTHANNMDQRLVWLPVVRQVAGQLNQVIFTVETPRDGSIAPPGDYMLFVLDNVGVPSVARFVNLR